MATHDVLTVKQYAEMGYDKLHRELLRMIREAERTVVQFNQSKQIQMLPALTAMKTLVAKPGRRFVVPGQPGWEEECRSLGIDPATVRQWKKRTGTEMDIRALLGESSEPKKKEAAVLDEARTLTYHRLVKLTKLILNGKDDEAEKMAHSIADEYGI